MFPLAVVGVLAGTLAQAGRVEVDVHKVHSKFGASCEDLETMFRNRVVSLQALLDAYPDESNFNAGTQARFVMRSYGIVRTLRRASACAWVADGDSDEIEQVRAIVQGLIAGNPCAEAARDELAAGRSAETSQIEVQSVWRAMSVLQSDNCEATAYEESDAVSLDNEMEAHSELERLEAQGQDNVDEMLDAMGDDAGAAFIETGSDVRMQSFRTAMRTLGVVFLMLFLLLACAGTVAAISAILAMTISQYTVSLWCPVCRSPTLAHAFNAVMFGFVPGAAVGLATCSYQLYTRLLPAISAPTNMTNVTH